jgi:hypothetical protein
MRRTLSALAVVVALLPPWLAWDVEIGAAAAAEQGAPARPNPENFQKGDLIWPRLPGAIVPYDSTPGAAGPEHELRWQRERNANLNRLTFLNTLSYDQFVERYLRDAPAPGVTPQSPRSNVPYVGHVGIIDVQDGIRWVIEAAPPEVRRIPYGKWLDERPKEIVWHARFKSDDPSLRARIADEAGRHLRRPYNFWNLDLTDETAFYCSKLGWLSIFKATAVPPDGNKDGKRSFWYSPKELMHSKEIEMLFSPEPY